MKSDNPLHPVFGELSRPWSERIWESHITVCFTPCDAGWSDLAIISSAFGQHHVAHLSYIGTPFHDLIDWLIEISHDHLPSTVLIDEEGVFTQLSVHSFDANHLEFRALRLGEGRISPVSSSSLPSERETKASILCRIEKYQFLAEWRRRFNDFIQNDYKPIDWEARCWNEYLHEGEPYPRWSDLRKLDFKKMDTWLQNNRLRTTQIKKIVSGGQTGADRAGLDWAIAHGITHGGWCPTGRLAEDGTISSIYQLEEVPDGGSYRRRTKANVRDSDATLILSIEAVLSGGSKETVLFAKRLSKHWLHLHPETNWREALRLWLSQYPIGTLNIAGPRATREPDVANFTMIVLDEMQSILNSPICS